MSEPKAMRLLRREIDELREREQRVRHLLVYWATVTPPSDWGVMKRFVKDLRLALDPPAGGRSC
jgi:hypothetical protein